MNQRRLLILIICLLFVSLAASGFLFYQNLQLKKQISQLSVQPSPIPLVSPSPAAEAETADWKTYTSNDQKFSFKVPKNLKVTQEERPIGIAPGKQQTIGIIFDNEKESPDALGIKYTTEGNNPFGGSGTAAGNLIDNGYISFFNQKIPKAKLVFNKMTTEIYYGGPPFTTVNIGQLKFLITLFWGLDSKNGIPLETENISDLILSTFKFLN
jgi:hypothetical protein